MAYEELILLKAFKNVHLKSCRDVKSEENCILEAMEKFLPVFQKSKVQNYILHFVLFGFGDCCSMFIKLMLQECLDDCLLSRKEVISTPAAGVLQPFVVTEQMKELVIQNFEAINIFRDYHSALSKRIANRNSVETILLGHFDEVFEKVSLQLLSIPVFSVLTDSTCLQVIQLLSNGHLKFCSQVLLRESSNLVLMQRMGLEMVKIFLRLTADLMKLLRVLSDMFSLHWKNLIHPALSLLCQQKI